MSESNRGPDDRELEQFLSGEGESSRRYRDALGSPASPPQLDRAVLDFAAAELTAARSRKPWHRPLALAASMLLAVGLLLVLLRDPEAHQQATTVPAPGPIASHLPGPVVNDAEQESVATADETSPAQVEAPKPAPAPRAEKKSQRDSAAAPVEESQSPPSPPPPPAAAAAAAVEMAPRIESPPVAAFSAAPQMNREMQSESRSRMQAGAKREARPLANVATLWRAPIFEGVQLGEATRESVRARFGEPSQQGISRPEQEQQPGGDDLPFDRYQRIPGLLGEIEFYYERVSAKLLTVRVRLPASTAAQTLLSELGWEELPTVRQGSQSPCAKSRTSLGGEAPSYPRYLVFPARGAYFYEASAGVVTEIVYEQSCP